MPKDLREEAAVDVFAAMNGNHCLPPINMAEASMTTLLAHLFESRPFERGDDFPGRESGQQTQTATRWAPMNTGSFMG